MLVLSLMRDERLVIDGRHVVQLCEIKSGGKVRLGIMAERSVPVHREVVFDAINGEGATQKLVESVRGGQAKSEAAQ